MARSLYFYERFDCSILFNIPSARRGQIPHHQPHIRMLCGCAGDHSELDLVEGEDLDSLKNFLAQGFDSFECYLFTVRTKNVRSS